MDQNKRTLLQVIIRRPHIIIIRDVVFIPERCYKRKYATTNERY